MNRLERLRRRRTAIRTVAAALLVAAGLPAGAAASAPLSIRVSAQRTGNGQTQRDIEVALANVSRAPVSVLPNLVRLRIVGAGAAYVPYPGPPIDPWGDAQMLAPGAAATLVFRDASDRRGVWRLPPGTYRVTAIYDVPKDLAPPESIAGQQPPWRGRLESPPETWVIGRT
jgi:hypothetical protein